MTITETFLGHIFWIFPLWISLRIATVCSSSWGSVDCSTLLSESSIIRLECETLVITVLSVLYNNCCIDNTKDTETREEAERAGHEKLLLIAWPDSTSQYQLEPHSAVQTDDDSCFKKIFFIPNMKMKQSQINSKFIKIENQIALPIWSVMLFCCYITQRLLTQLYTKH